jgi:hypothetical protein
MRSREREIHGSGASTDTKLSRRGTRLTTPPDPNPNYKFNDTEVFLHALRRGMRARAFSLSIARRSASDSGVRFNSSTPMAAFTNG